MEPAAGPGRGSVCPAPGGERGTDPGQGSSAAGRAPEAQGSWSGATGGNWITTHPTVGRAGGPLVSRGSRCPARTPQDSPLAALEVHVGSPQEGSGGRCQYNRLYWVYRGGSGPWGSWGMPLLAGVEVINRGIPAGKRKCLKLRLRLNFYHTENMEVFNLAIVLC